MMAAAQTELTEYSFEAPSPNIASLHSQGSLDSCGERPRREIFQDLHALFIAAPFELGVGLVRAIEFIGNVAQ